MPFMFKIKIEVSNARALTVRCTFILIHIDNQNQITGDSRIQCVADHVFGVRVQAIAYSFSFFILLLSQSSILL